MIELKDLFENEVDLGFTANNQPAPEIKQNNVQQGQTMEEFLANPIVPDNKHAQPFIPQQEAPVSSNPLDELQNAANTIAGLNAAVGNPIEEDDGVDWKDIISKDATRFKEIPDTKLTKELCMIAVSKSGYLLMNVPDRFIDDEIIARAVATSPEIIVQVHGVKKRPESEWLIALEKQPSIIKQLPDDVATPNVLNTFYNKFKGTQWATYILEKYKDKRKDNQHTQTQVAQVQQPERTQQEQTQPQQSQQPQTQQEQSSQNEHKDIGQIIEKMSVISGLMLSLKRTQEELEQKIDEVYKDIRNIR